MTRSTPSSAAPRSRGLHASAPGWALLAASIALFHLGATFGAHASSPDPATLDKIARLSVPFVPNAGQWDSRAAFAAQTFAGTLFVTKRGELVYSLPGKAINVGVGSSALQPHPEATPSRRLQRSVGADLAALGGRQPGARTPGWVLSETLVDAKGQPRSMSQSTLKAPAGYRPMEGKVSYGIGNDESKHANNLNTYERVNLGDVYPGVNVQLRATGNNVEKIFIVAPRHDPKQIHIALKGAEKLEIGKDGDLIAHTGNGPVAFTAPIAFQETASGERAPVRVAYVLHADQQRYSFTVGDYDATQPLVIDPLLQSTYLGGTNEDYGTALAIHPASGEVYVAGITTSTDLPGISGGAQSVYSTGNDAFVSRFNAALTMRLQSSYLGGTGTDFAFSLAIHPASGEVYVAGYTNSTDLPGVSGGAQSGKSTSNDAFVTRFNAALTTRLQSSYLGGTGNEQARAIAIHPSSDEVYVAGYTDSTDLPGVGGGAQSAKSTGNDAFVTRFNAALTTRLQSSYHGGTGFDEAYALAFHPASGEVYVAGDTSSTDLPGISGGAQSIKSTGNDAFVTRFNAALTTRLQSSYLGGTGGDYPRALAIHPASGEVYVAGYTDSTDLPGVGGGAQSAKSTGNDAFVTRLNAALTTRLQSSYLGGGGFGGFDNAYALAIHPATGEVYVAGFTESTDFPGVGGGAQSVNSAFRNAFVTRFNAALTTRLQSSYLGGTGGSAIAYALAIHPASGEVYVAGHTASLDLPGVGGGAQSAKSGGNYDAFVSRFSADLTLNDSTPTPFAFLVQTGVPLGSVRTSNPALISGIDGAANIYVDGALGSQYCISSGNNCTCNVSAGFVASTGTITSNNYVCVRHVSAPITNGWVESLLHVGGAAASFISTTGTAFTSCSLDIDGSGGAPNAATDGLMLVRAMLGFTGTNVTNGAIFGSPPRNTWALIRDYLNNNCGTSFAP